METEGCKYKVSFFEALFAINLPWRDSLRKSLHGAWIKRTAAAGEGKLNYV